MASCSSTATAAISIYFLKHDPKLVERRMKAGPTAEQRPVQKIIMCHHFAGFVLLIVLPGLDHRWHWSAVPPWFQYFAANAGARVELRTSSRSCSEQNSYAAVDDHESRLDQPVDLDRSFYAIVRHPSVLRARCSFCSHAAGAWIVLDVAAPSFHCLLC